MEDSHMRLPAMPEILAMWGVEGGPPRPQADRPTPDHLADYWHRDHPAEALLGH